MFKSIINNLYGQKKCTKEDIREMAGNNADNVVEIYLKPRYSKKEDTGDIFIEITDPDKRRPNAEYDEKDLCNYWHCSSKKDDRKNGAVEDITSNLYCEALDLIEFLENSKIPYAVKLNKSKNIIPITPDLLRKRITRI